MELFLVQIVLSRPFNPEKNQNNDESDDSPGYPRPYFHVPDGHKNIADGEIHMNVSLSDLGMRGVA